MPTSTIWLKLRHSDVRVFKTKVSNAILVKKPEIIALIDGKTARSERTIGKCHWEKVGTGQTLTTETVLKDPEGNIVPLAQALCILEKTKNVEIDEKAETVDKKKEILHIQREDGSIDPDEVRPFPPTERIEIFIDPAEAKEQGQGYWVPSTSIEGFLISEEYELPAADINNDAKLYKDIEEAMKRDEIAVLTYSNGGFAQYFAFLIPIVKDGKFEWSLRVSDKKVERNCLRDIPGVAAPVREVKTLETLPPIAQLLTVPIKKK